MDRIRKHSKSIKSKEANVVPPTPTRFLLRRDGAILKDNDGNQAPAIDDGYIKIN